ncbi:GNAT family N-acetyltransferase [Methanoculleus sp. FWC-SCC1]|uniref:GNAT family N-acetyltransferase n=1 Tax=Methanoculleus frigidifontis TaxID=2584085 RepID=A0ABT8MCU7_9EURY|nr:GNAT family N-acetyltransferase [Methanoculleus sp. FWC-SCC1]MDN7025770.1 GNAT family N-acetyltransferase [Methanoculleus sp. FWC-SCC1]
MPRLIRPDELGALLALYRILHPEDPVCTDAAGLESLWQEICGDPNLFCIVHEADGVPVSSCTLAVVKNLTRGFRPYGVIENVITHPGYRRKGYGTAVLHEAVRLARERRCYKVMLATGAKDEATLRFYENAGFSRGVKTDFVVYF